MRNTTPLCSALAILLLTACHKGEDGGPGAAITVSDYSNLEAGNSWVYEVYAVDSSGVVAAQPLREDSVFVEGDTLMNGENWTRLRTITSLGGTSVDYLRDSVDCIVNAWEGAYFCYSLTDRIFRTEIFPGLVQNDWTAYGATVFVTVPAGVFNARMIRSVPTSLGGPETPEYRIPRSYWKQGIGMVLRRVHYYISGSGFEYRLLRYHVV